MFIIFTPCMCIVRGNILTWITAHSQTSTHTAAQFDIKDAPERYTGGRGQWELNQLQAVIKLGKPA